MRRIDQVKKRLRKLKVHRHWRELRNYWQYYPELRLKGVWLELAGFEVGDEVRVEVWEDQLIITKLPKAEKSKQ